MGRGKKKFRTYIRELKVYIHFHIHIYIYIFPLYPCTHIVHTSCLSTIIHATMILSCHLSTLITSLLISSNTIMPTPFQHCSCAASYTHQCPRSISLPLGLFGAQQMFVTSTDPHPLSPFPHSNFPYGLRI